MSQRQTEKTDFENGLQERIVKIERTMTCLPIPGPLPAFRRKVCSGPFCAVSSVVDDAYPSRRRPCKGCEKTAGE